MYILSEVEYKNNYQASMIRGNLIGSVDLEPNWIRETWVLKANYDQWKTYYRSKQYYFTWVNCNHDMISAPLYFNPCHTV